MQGSNLAVVEGGGQLALDEDVTSQVAKRSEGWLVLDFVAEESAGDVGPGLGLEAVAMIPEGEWSAELTIAEVIVPYKLSDLCLPLGADGREREGSEAKGHQRSCAGCHR